MDLTAALNQWNSIFASNLPLTQELFAATYFKKPKDQRIELKNDLGMLLAYVDNNQIRVSFASPEAVGLYSELLSIAKSIGIHRISFGGGMNHIFPGIPKTSEFKNWLDILKPSGEEVSDFEGDISKLIHKSQSSYTEDIGELRSPRTESEVLVLVNFVEKEFPGHWEREIKYDQSQHNMEHYFGYFFRDELVGYVRLYGWKKNYWAPGVYFSGPGQGQGGLGPIGIAKSHRGKGLGRHALSLSWKVLKEHHCSRIRIDWTTEKDFYQRAGLENVQSYQPAAVNIE